MNVYAKVSELAKMDFDNNGNSIPVFYNLEEPPVLNDEEMKAMIGELTGVPVEFISIITQEEYEENVEEEMPFKEKGCCGGCSDCGGGCK